VVGLGCNNIGGSFGGRLDLSQTRSVVDAAIDCGITLLDTSNSYGNRGGSEIGCRARRIVGPEPGASSVEPTWVIRELRLTGPGPATSPTGRR
jgi:aryl-alcohol dehydrogenase-like predicted oxidoreductase